MGSNELKCLVKECLLEILGDMATEKKEILISRTEAARKLGKSRVTLYRWEKEGYLTPVMMGDRAMYKMSDLRELMHEKKEA